MEESKVIKLRKLVSLVVVFVGVIFASIASAHSFNESYVYFNVSDDSLSGRVEASTTDLAKVFAPNSEEMTEPEIQARLPEIFAYFDAGLKLTANGEQQPVKFVGVEFLETDFGKFAQLNFEVPDLVVIPDTIEVDYQAMFSDVDPDHRAFGLIESNTRTGVTGNESYISLIFDPSDGAKTLYLNGEPAFQVALEFLEHGVWHIWLGFDHVLFLFTLLVSGVMVIVAGRWEPSSSLHESLVNTIKVVTVFTVAHTITLGLATFNIVSLPVVLVEAVIALSIAIVALGNLFPKLHVTSWKLVFVFGLFHGFGFANVLTPLGLDPARKAIGLATFNLGVELGQVAIVLLAFPALFYARKFPAYRLIVMQIGSLFFIAIALFWFIERTYDVLGPVRYTIATMLGLGG